MRVEKMGQLNFNDFIRYYVWWLILGIASLVLGAIAGQKEAFAICLVGFVILVVGGIPISIYGARYEARTKERKTRKKQ